MSLFRSAALQRVSSDDLLTKKQGGGVNTDIKFVEKIIALRKDNKDHEIHYLVDTDLLLDNSFQWMSGVVTSVSLGLWLETEWGIKTDVESIEEYFWENDEKYSEAEKGLVPELVELIASAKPAILVRVGM